MISAPLTRKIEIRIKIVKTEAYKSTKTQFNKNNNKGPKKTNLLTVFALWYLPEFKLQRYEKREYLFFFFFYDILNFNNPFMR